jgi:hypothetical protein
MGDKHTRVFSSKTRGNEFVEKRGSGVLHGSMFTRRFLNLLAGLFALINFDG